MMRFLGLVAITITCFVVACGITAIAACFLPDAIKEIRLAFRKEEKKVPAARAKVIPLTSGIYTYDKQRKLIRMSEARVARR